MFCTRCAGYFFRRAWRLAGQCCGEFGARKGARNRVFKNRFPTAGGPFAGHLPSDLRQLSREEGLTIESQLLATAVRPEALPPPKGVVPRVRPLEFALPVANAQAHRPEILAAYGLDEATLEVAVARSERRRLRRKQPAHLIQRGPPTSDDDSS